MGVVKMLKDYVKDINMESAVNLVNFAYDNHYEVTCYEGVLLDNYIIHSDKTLKVGRAKPREYIILRERFVNEWTSKIEMTLTDNEKTLDRHDRELVRSDDEE